LPSLLVYRHYQLYLWKQCDRQRFKSSEDGGSKLSVVSHPRRSSYQHHCENIRTCSLMDVWTKALFRSPVTACFEECKHYGVWDTGRQK
jgi:hypothetical protein